MSLHSGKRLIYNLGFFFLADCLYLLLLFNFHLYSLKYSVSAFWVLSLVSKYSRKIYEDHFGFECKLGEYINTDLKISL